MSLVSKSKNSFRFSCFALIKLARDVGCDAALAQNQAGIEWTMPIIPFSRRNLRKDDISTLASITSEMRRRNTIKAFVFTEIVTTCG